MTKDERFGTSKEQDNKEGAAKPVSSTTGTAGAGAGMAAKPPVPKPPGFQPPGLHPKPPFGMPAMPAQPKIPPAAAKPPVDKDPKDGK